MTDGTTNASLRKGDTVEGITPERAVELLADRRAAGPRPARGRGPAKKATSTTKKATATAKKATGTTKKAAAGKRGANATRAPAGAAKKVAAKSSRTAEEGWFQRPVCRDGAVDRAPLAAEAASEKATVTKSSRATKKRAGG